MAINRARVGPLLIIDAELRRTPSVRPKPKEARREGKANGEEGMLKC